MTERSLEFRTPSTPTNGNGELAFSAMQEAWRRAVAARPEEVVQTGFALAGRVIRMAVVGRRLADVIGKPFGHLPRLAESERPHLVIELWDEAATSVARPRLPQQTGQDAALEARMDPSLTIGSPDDRHLGHLRPGLCAWIDRTTAHIVACCPSADQLSAQDRGKPLQFPLLVWLADQGAPVAHAAFLSCEERGILLVGKGGTGKTTVALACLRDGFDFLADDYVALEDDGGRLLGHSLYDSVWLTREAERLFPEWISHAETVERMGAPTKRLLRMSAAAPTHLASSSPIHVVVSTVLGTRASAIRPMAKAAALLALAPSSMLQLPVSSRLLLERMSQVIEHLPAYALEVGRDLDALPRLVRGLVSQHERP
jgi:hypothetical protein